MDIEVQYKAFDRYICNIVMTYWIAGHPRGRQSFRGFLHSIRDYSRTKKFNDCWWIGNLKNTSRAILELRHIAKKQWYDDKESWSLFSFFLVNQYAKEKTKWEIWACSVNSKKLWIIFSRSLAIQKYPSLFFVKAPLNLLFTSKSLR